MTEITLGQQQLKFTVVEADDRIAVARLDDSPMITVRFAQSLLQQCDFVGFPGLRFVLDANVKEIADDVIRFDAPCRFIVRGLQGASQR